MEGQITTTKLTPGNNLRPPSPSPSNRSHSQRLQMEALTLLLRGHRGHALHPPRGQRRPRGLRGRAAGLRLSGPCGLLARGGGGETRDLSVWLNWLVGWLVGCTHDPCFSISDKESRRANTGETQPWNLRWFTLLRSVCKCEFYR